MTTQSDSLITNEVLRAEEERLRIFADGDYKALSEIMDDDLTYTHLTGELNRKSDYIEHMKDTFETNGEGTIMTREGLEVRTYGDVAIMSGRLYNHRDGARSPARIVLQVWVKKSGRWRVVAHQTTALSEEFQ